MRQQSVYKVIQKCHELYGYPIEMSCKLLHVARSAYHKWASDLGLLKKSNISIPKIRIKGIAGSTMIYCTITVSMSMTNGCCASAG